jgi:FlaG/FlaF family flagellin (archaellin)
MNQRTLAITAILAASILSVVVISTPMAFADESETVIEQEERQENV